MLSVAASFRAAARRQTFRLPGAAVTRAASSSAAKHSADGPQTMSELSDTVLDIAEEQEIIRAGRAGELPFDDNIIDSGAFPASPSALLSPDSSLAPVVGSKDYPTLKGFQPGQVRRPTVLEHVPEQWKWKSAYLPAGLPLYPPAITPMNTVVEAISGKRAHHTDRLPPHILRVGQSIADGRIVHHQSPLMPCSCSQYDRDLRKL